MARGPGTSPEIVGWEKGARTCLHVRPGRLTILECHFNKTMRYHPKRKVRGGGNLVVVVRCFIEATLECSEAPGGALFC
jgi:hypothetical protein